MGLINALVSWTQTTFAPLGAPGLFILAFMESSFFPIPPDVLLIVLVLGQPALWLWYALVATLGSAIGGVFGYGIGYVGEEAILRRMVKPEKIAKVHRLFNRYEAWAIFIAGFTPIPYKVFTIAAGVFYIDLKKFVIASVLSRGLRFFLVAFFVSFFGESMVTFINDYFDMLSVVVVSVALIGYLLYRKMNRKMNYGPIPSKTQKKKADL
ncbi:MAG: DedA family protein [DPANN group archaeon]|nr:DedA family protein [DPANN group archaeon]